MIIRNSKKKLKNIKILSFLGFFIAPSLPPKIEGLLTATLSILLERFEKLDNKDTSTLLAVL